MKTNHSILLLLAGLLGSVCQAQNKTDSITAEQYKEMQKALGMAEMESKEPTDTAYLYQLGQQHANKYYNYDWTAGIFITTAVASPIGLVSAIWISSTPPKEHNFECPDYELLKNNNYRMGYMREAHRIKSIQTWKNFGFGILVSGVVVGIILASQ